MAGTGLFRQKKQVLMILGMMVFFLGGGVRPGAQENSHYYSGLLVHSGFQENYEIRRKLSSEFYAPHPEEVESPKRVFTQAVGPQRVMFDLRRTAKHFYLCFINEKDFRFPLLSRGTWIVKKEIDTGRFVQAKIFLLPEEGSFLRLFPFDDRTRMDVYLYGNRLYKDILLPFPFEQTLTMPFSRLISLSWSNVDWQTLFPDARWEEWRWMESFVKAIRERLEDLPDAEDGALGQDGQFRRIETGEPAQGAEAGLNCSGFAKWLGDALYYPYTDAYMSLERLKEKPLETRGHSWSEMREDSRDPYFGLDWTRNMAALIFEGYYGRPSDSVEDHDLREVPFFSYKEDVGYPAEDLAPVIFQAASRDPGSLFLASLSTPFRPEGEEVSLRQHVHVAVILPYFDRRGIFHPVVMDRNRESSLEELANRYPDSYIHLVRVPLRDRFSLPPLPPGAENSVE